jgi:hypothetical protein
LLISILFLTFSLKLILKLMRQDTLNISTKRLGRILYCGSWKRQILHLYFFFSIDSSLIRSQATGFLICKVFSCFLRSFRVEQIFLSWHRSEERSVADLIEHDFAVLIASKLQVFILYLVLMKHFFIFRRKETILNCLKFSQLGAIQIDKEIRLVLLSLSMLLPGAKVSHSFKIYTIIMQSVDDLS